MAAGRHIDLNSPARGRVTKAPRLAGFAAVLRQPDKESYVAVCARVSSNGWKSRGATSLHSRRLPLPCVRTGTGTSGVDISQGKQHH